MKNKEFLVYNKRPIQVFYRKFLDAVKRNYPNVDTEFVPTKDLKILASKIFHLKRQESKVFLLALARENPEVLLSNQGIKIRGDSDEVQN